MIQIDGSYGEGGGQVLRTSLSLAAITGQAVEIVKIRAGRTKPGLQPQHLASVRAAAALCDARIEGDAVHSQRLLFEPQTASRPDVYRCDIGTAGATALVAQTILAPLWHASAGSKVTITGGTHVPNAPTADYLDAVYLPVLRRAGLDVRFDCPRAGYFPRGGGEITLDIAASRLAPIDFTERGKLRRLTALIITSELPDHVGERGAAAVAARLKQVGRKAEIEQRRRPSRDPGAAVVLVATCEGGAGGFTALGARGKPMEQVAEEACDAFMKWWKSGAACDEHLADQLVLPMALVNGESRWTAPEVTEHLRTVLWVARQFLPIEATLEEQPGGGGTVVLRRR